MTNLLCHCAAPATVDVIIDGRIRRPCCESHADALEQQLPVLAPGRSVHREPIPYSTDPVPAGPSGGTR